mgnify:FL=1
MGLAGFRGDLESVSYVLNKKKRSFFGGRFPIRFVWLGPIVKIDKASQGHRGVFQRVEMFLVMSHLRQVTNDSLDFVIGPEVAGYVHF